jgi:hypothetical protein
MRDPFDTMKEISLTHPSLRQGIPDRVGYFWCVESLDPDWPKVSLVLVKDGKVFTFGGKRIPNPKADKMYYQDGIVPPYPTADYK